jgi:hypothetical protein
MVWICDQLDSTDIWQVLTNQLRTAMRSRFRRRPTVQESVYNLPSQMTIAIYRISQHLIGREVLVLMYCVLPLSLCSLPTVSKGNGSNNVLATKVYLTTERTDVGVIGALPVGGIVALQRRSNRRRVGPA